MVYLGCHSLVCQWRTKTCNSNSHFSSGVSTLSILSSLHNQRITTWSTIGAFSLLWRSQLGSWMSTYYSLGYLVLSVSSSSWNGQIQVIVPQSFAHSFLQCRIWIFSKRNVLLIGFLAALCTTIIALDILVTVQILQNRSVAEFGEKKTEIIITFTLGAICKLMATISLLTSQVRFFIADLVLASLLCYYVRRNTSGFEKYVRLMVVKIQEFILCFRTDSMISLIVKYAVTTGLVTRWVSHAHKYTGLTLFKTTFQHMGYPYSGCG